MKSDQGSNEGSSNNHRNNSHNDVFTTDDGSKDSKDITKSNTALDKPNLSTSRNSKTDQIQEPDHSTATTNQKSKTSPTPTPTLTNGTIVTYSQNPGPTTSPAEPLQLVESNPPSRERVYGAQSNTTTQSSEHVYDTEHTVSKFSPEVSQNLAIHNDSVSTCVHGMIPYVARPEVAVNELRGGRKWSGPAQRFASYLLRGERRRNVSQPMLVALRTPTAHIPTSNIFRVLRHPLIFLGLRPSFALNGVVGRYGRMAPVSDHSSSAGRGRGREGRGGSPQGRGEGEMGDFGGGGGGQVSSGASGGAPGGGGDGRKPPGGNVDKDKEEEGEEGEEEEKKEGGEEEEEEKKEGGEVCDSGLGSLPSLKQASLQEKSESTFMENPVFCFSPPPLFPWLYVVPSLPLQFPPSNQLTPAPPPPLHPHPVLPSPTLPPLPIPFPSRRPSSTSAVPNLSPEPSSESSTDSAIMSDEEDLVVAHQGAQRHNGEQLVLPQQQPPDAPEGAHQHGPRHDDEPRDLQEDGGPVDEDDAPLDQEGADQNGGDGSRPPVPFPSLAEPRSDSSV